MANPNAIEDNFITAVKAIDGLSDALTYEPQALPRYYPVVTMFFIGAPQETVATGQVEVTWHWKINIYVGLTDFKKGQDEMKRLVPLLLAITRADHTLGETCDWSEITDEEEEPTIGPDDKWIVKRLDLRAKTIEP